jgi:hypothetical protein
MNVYHINVKKQGFGSWFVSVEVEENDKYIIYSKIVTDSEMIDSHSEGDSQELINFVTDYKSLYQ